MCYKYYWGVVEGQKSGGYLVVHTVIHNTIIGVGTSISIAYMCEMYFMPSIRCAPVKVSPLIGIWHDWVSHQWDLCITCGHM